MQCGNVFLLAKFAPFHSRVHLEMTTGTDVSHQLQFHHLQLEPQYPCTQPRLSLQLNREVEAHIASLLTDC